MSKGQPKLGYALIPKEESKDIMTFEEFRSYVKSNEEDPFSGKPFFNSYENMYEQYVQDCKRHNASKLELVIFEYFEGERDIAFKEQILSKYPDATIFPTE